MGLVSRCEVVGEKERLTIPMILFCFQNHGLSVHQMSGARRKSPFYLLSYFHDLILFNKSIHGTLIIRPEA
jgi:hypothetical protein